MKYDCNLTGCNDNNHQLFEDKFNFLPDILYNGIEEIIERFVDSDNISSATDPIQLTNLIMDNVTSISQMKSLLIANFFKY